MFRRKVFFFVLYSLIYMRLNLYRGRNKWPWYNIITLYGYTCTVVLSPSRRKNWLLLQLYRHWTQKKMNTNASNLEDRPSRLVYNAVELSYIPPTARQSEIDKYLVEASGSCFVNVAKTANHPATVHRVYDRSEQSDFSWMPTSRSGGPTRSDRDRR